MTYVKYLSAIQCNSMKDRRIWTLKQFSSYFAYPTYHGMRNRYAKRKEKGLEDAFIKDGKTVLVDVDKFWEIFNKKTKKE